jgi:hypothetical protein
MAGALGAPCARGSQLKSGNMAALRAMAVMIMAKGMITAAGRLEHRDAFVHQVQIEHTGDAVDQAEAEQHEGHGDEVHHQIQHGIVDRLLVLLVHDQDGDDQHAQLDEDVDVEQVAAEEDAEHGGLEREKQEQKVLSR